MQPRTVAELLLTKPGGSTITIELKQLNGHAFTIRQVSNATTRVLLCASTHDARLADEAHGLAHADAGMNALARRLSAALATTLRRVRLEVEQQR